MSKYLVKAICVHLIDAKHVMKYLNGTTDFGVYFDGDHDYILYGYTDADWAGSVSDKKTTLGGCYCLRSAMISWFSRKQSSVALNTNEAEYIAACSVSCESIWLQKLMSGLFDLVLDTTVILCDNQSCIKMTENPVFHDKSKHIEIWYFYIWGMVQKGAIKLQYVSTDDQVVDVVDLPSSKGGTLMIML